MNSELQKESLFEDLNGLIDDVELLMRDYGYDFDECDEDDDEPCFQDDDIIQLYETITKLKQIIDK